MAILDLVNRPIFHPRFKLPMHVLQIVLVSTSMGLSVPRLFMKNQPRTRASTIALGMGAKSLILLLYMIVTEHVERFKRWHSYKANVIISCLEILFWGGVAFLVMQANLKRCVGTMCILSWIVVGLAVVINNTEIYVALISFRQFREYRKHGSVSQLNERSTHELKRSDEEMQLSQQVEEPKQAYSPERYMSRHSHERRDSERGSAPQGARS